MAATPESFPGPFRPTSGPFMPADDPTVRVALTLRTSDRDRLYRIAEWSRRTPSEQVAWLVDEECSRQQRG